MKGQRSLRKLLSFTAVIGCLLISGCIITLNPTGDTWVLSTDPLANYCYSDCQWSQNLTSGVARQYFQFDTSSVTGTVNSAILRLYYCQGCTPLNSVLGAFEVLDYWDHCLLDWVNQPPHNLGPEDEVFCTAGGPPYVEFDITGLVQTWVDEPAKNFGVVLKVDEDIPGSLFSFFSVDGTTSTMPQLTIDYAP
ncbi:DNRLRE domain-containing protein [Thermodesulfobacteriota bacterium]